MANETYGWNYRLSDYYVQHSDGAVYVGSLYVGEIHSFGGRGTLFLNRGNVDERITIPNDFKGALR